VDNCGGGNKNNHVILLAPYLVEMQYFETVNVIFLVAGHTKNVCDRRFDNLKIDYHRSQVFTFGQAVEILGRSPFVTVWPVQPEKDWFDYYNMMLLAYRRLEKPN
jgi:hypothetical protein